MWKYSEMGGSVVDTWLLGQAWVVAFSNRRFSHRDSGTDL